jgi:hypothetical protein
MTQDYPLQKSGEVIITSPLIWTSIMNKLFQKYFCFSSVVRRVDEVGTHALFERKPERSPVYSIKIPSFQYLPCLQYSKVCEKSLLIVCLFSFIKSFFRFFKLLVYIIRFLYRSSISHRHFL